MARIPSVNQSKEPTQTEAELQNSVAGTPLSPIEQLAQAASVEKIAHRVKTGTRIAMLSSMVLMSNPSLAEKSPYEPLVDASGKTQLVLKEDGKGKEELFAAFERNIRSEQTKEIKKNAFNRLSSEYQKKVLSYYQTGKTEQPDERTLLKGVYAMLSLYENIEIAKQWIAEFSAGKEPSRDPLAFEPMVKTITETFPSGKNFVDIVAIQKIDVMVGSVYVQIWKKAEQEWKKAEQEWKKSEQRRKKIQEEIDLVNTLLRAI